MNVNTTESFASLSDALDYVNLFAGIFINETIILLPNKSPWSSVFNLIPLLLGFIGFLFNILALLSFTASKTFRQSSFRCYIYAFVLVNGASILTHSWVYLFFYLVDHTQVCKYIQYFQQSLSTTSLWIMVLLSFERSFTFKQPYKVKKLLKSRTICLILFFVICSCFALHIGELISTDIKGFRWINFAYGLCSIKRYSRLADRIRILTHSHTFILPFLLNSVLDVYICYNICQRRKRFTGQVVSKSRRRSKISLANEITVTLLCQSLWLLITYFPTHLYYALISFKLINDHDRDNSTLVFIIRQNLLIYLAFSPTLYVILSPTLRREIAQHLCRSYKRKRTVSSSYLSSASRRLEKLLNSRTRSSHQRTRLTILVTRSEELPRRFDAVPIIIPRHLSCEIKSKSDSCLSTYSHDEEFDHVRKTERSSTVHE